jgi:XisH protein
MPAKDIFHDCFKAALIKDGWHISHDPYNLKVGKKDLFIDLGAEKLLAADKGSQKIAVEIKSLVEPSIVSNKSLSNAGIHKITDATPLARLSNLTSLFLDRSIACPVAASICKIGPIRRSPSR